MFSLTISTKLLITYKNILNENWMISNRIQFDINNFFANKNIENINEK